MTSEEHRKAAEKLLAGRHERTGPWIPVTTKWVPPTADEVARAQAHATLALVAQASERNLHATIDMVEIRPAVPR